MAEITTDKDTGWGVIYRLNALFNQVEELAPTGKYDEWNFKLDRIWSNLMYREDLDIITDKEENIKSINFDEEAHKIKVFFDKEIADVKRKMRLIKKKYSDQPDKGEKHKDYILEKNKLYSIILKKEIWLRKWMRELQLYLKEIVRDPSGAMFGSG